MPQETDVPHRSPSSLGNYVGKFWFVVSCDIVAEVLVFCDIVSEVLDVIEVDFGFRYDGRCPAGCAKKDNLKTTEQPPSQHKKKG